MDTSYYKKYEPIFGKWHIVRELGEGSFGKVFEIEHRDLSGTYSSALKVITIPRNKTELAQVASENTGPDGVTKYFRSIVDGITKEFNIMSQLKGESTIVSYEDHEVREHTDGIGWDIFIRMELLTPLLQYTANYPLSRNDIIRLGIDICSALELCRKNAIIHRDIKPENIFVSKNGRFKLGDFGIAKNIDKTTSELTKTGTYTYMAPEVYKGEAYGASVDIYSLGIVLYNYTNNGRSPFISATQSSVLPAEKTEALLRRMKGEALPTPANADDALSRVILKACAYLPRDRYLTPTDMRRDLEALLDGRSVGVSSLDKTVGIFGNRSTATTEAPAEKPSDEGIIAASGNTKPVSGASLYHPESLPTGSSDGTVDIFSGSKRPAKSDSPAVAPSDKTDPDLSKPEKDDRTQPHSADNRENTPVNSGKHTESKTGKGIKILAATLAVCLVLAIGIFALVKSGVFSEIPNLNIGSGTSSDSVSGTCGDNLEWTFSGGTLTISGEGVMYDYEYDADLNSLAPWGDCEIEKIVIKTGVTGIGKYAFFKCDQLRKVTIPGSVTSIGYGAFESCTSLKSVTIPDGVTYIGASMFMECTSLKSVSIPASVTRIDATAFIGCDSLTDIYYSGSEEQWNSISIDGGTTALPSATVHYNSDSQAKTDPSENENCGDNVYWSFSGGTLIISGEGAMYDYEYGYDPRDGNYSTAPWGELDITEIVVEDGVTSIGEFAFGSCSSLTSVAIPDSVTSIGSYAFDNCTSLTSVAIPDSVTSIGEWAFSDCTSLTSVAIPDSVTSIGEWAFSDCTSLTSVAIPDSVTSIGEWAFSDCTSLTSVAIPDSVTSIGSYAFNDCTSLTSVTIPDSVTSIGHHAFSGCTSLTSVAIPDSVTSIGHQAFSWCTSLTSVAIPDSVTSIGEAAFNYCNSLTDVYYSGSEAQWASINIGESNDPLTSATVHYYS